MKISQVVLVKTKSGNWKILVMSLTETVQSTVYDTPGKAVAAVNTLTDVLEWEQLSND